MEPLSFDHVPTLIEILRGGGRPGFQYALVTPDRINDLKGEAETNWDIIGNLPPIVVRGKSAFLMGAGGHVPGASAAATVPHYWVDKEFSDAAKPGPQAGPKDKE